MEIADIKAHLSMATLLQHYNLKPDKHNRICCPFHEDKTPSMQVYYKTQTAYCFSSNCKTHGKSLDVIDFIMYKENLDKHNAILKAEQMINGSIAPDSTTRKLSKTDILSKMFTYFKNAVHNSPPAKQYIESRKLDYEKLEIGYNSGQFHHGARKDETLIKQCLQIGILQDAGLVSKTGEKAYRPFGKWCIVFPLKNKVNQVSGLYFRSTLNDTDKRHYYLENRQGLYPCYPNPETEKLILTEAIIDAATLLQLPEIMKYYSVLACYGTNGFTAEHEGSITKLSKLKEIIFFFDGDKAGKEAVNKYATLFKELLPSVKITNIETPENEDVNSLLQGHEPSVLLHFIDNRTDFFFSTEKATEKKTTEIQEATTEPETQPTTKANQLDTSNPLSLKYQGTEAEHRIKGFNPRQTDSLRISLQIINNETRHDHRAKLDLYEYKQVKQTAHDAAERLGLRNDFLERDLFVLTTLLEDYRDKAITTNADGHGMNGAIVIPMTAQERAQAENILGMPNLVYHLGQMLGQAGIVGEEKNRIFLFVTAVSHITPDTLHVLIQGSSGSGKTRLLRIISDCMPPEKVVRLTRVSDKSFYNYPEYYLKNKLVSLEDVDGLTEESEYAYRELVSNGELISSTCIKEENSHISSGQKIVRGPIASMACTTNGAVYEDNISRMFIVAVDESKEQTLRVIFYQNAKSAGKTDASKEESIKRQLQNVVRTLKPIPVINPYADQVHLPPEAHKLRRLNDLFNIFIQQVTIINQCQRKKDAQGRLISALEDVETAIDIMFDSIVLKVDELDGSLRQFYEKLKDYIKTKDNPDKYEFTQREIRQALNVSKASLSRYISDLVSYEYVQELGGGNNRKARYRIDWWDNYISLRNKIKAHLNDQVQKLKG